MVAVVVGIINIQFTINYYDEHFQGISKDIHVIKACPEKLPNLNATLSCLPCLLTTTAPQRSSQAKSAAIHPLILKSVQGPSFWFSPFLYHHRDLVPTASVHHVSLSA